MSLRISSERQASKFAKLVTSGFGTVPGSGTGPHYIPEAVTHPSQWRGARDPCTDAGFPRPGATGPSRPGVPRQSPRSGSRGQDGGSPGQRDARAERTRKQRDRHVTPPRPWGHPGRHIAARQPPATNCAPLSALRDPRRAPSPANTRPAGGPRCATGYRACLSSSIPAHHRRPPSAPLCPAPLPSPQCPRPQGRGRLTLGRDLRLASA